MRSEMRSAFIALLTVVSAMGTAGCQRQILPASAVDQFGTADDELDFLAEVHNMTAVTNNDALHGLFLFADGVDPATDYDERVALAKTRRWMPTGFDEPANESAPVGWLAMAGCEICDIKGGLTMHVLGPTPRYCTKELVFLQVLPLRTENQSLTGAEFNDYLNRLHRVRASVPLVATVEGTAQGPAGEEAATPMNEAAEEEMLPSPSGSTEPKIAR